MRTSTPRPFLAAVLAGAALLSLLPIVLAPGTAAEPPADRAQLAAEGSVTYRLYCKNCHGPSGRGDGQLAGMIAEKPSDLTALARDNGGEYPVDRVRSAIDGRQEVAAHGSREMPVWGEAFDDADGRSVERKIDGLVYYVAGLQKGAGVEAAGFNRP